MNFIKNNSLKTDYDDLFYSPAVCFRKTFILKSFSKATLRVCGLGCGYYYINGKQVCGDLFVAPVSDYNKTLWYTEYDVTKFLSEGKNVICAYLGNGFFNENFNSPWDYNKAPWRDVPKLSLRLKIDDIIIDSDESFKTNIDKAVYYNQLRSGEYFDSRYDYKWLNVDFDDSLWETAVYDNNAPKGVAKTCLCPPIKECKTYLPIAVYKNNCGYIFDFGQNFSGYVEYSVSEQSGKELTISFAEEIDDNFNLKLNNLDVYYPSVPFQTDKIICNGELTVWKPKFTYHGFRYMQVKGLSKKPSIKDVKGIFVHQDIKRWADFSCSNEMLNKIYKAGIMSTYSNMFYMLTDCPTREKLGWTNDAAASMEQILYNFDCVPLLDKWADDIIDAMRDDGALPGIIPTSGYGYELGPVTDAVLFELPYRVYIHTGDKSIAEKLYPYLMKYLGFFDKRLKSEQWFHLGDWTGLRNKNTPNEFIDCALMICFLDKSIYLCDILGADNREFLIELRKLYADSVLNKYVVNGDSVIDEQTAISMLICLDLGDLDKLKNHLVNKIKQDDMHLNCGMIGTQFIYDALSKVGENDLVLDLISNPTPPSFAYWINNGATTLYETFVNEYTDSKNHHMFSNIIGWFIKNILGVTFVNSLSIDFKPKYFKDINSVSGFITVMNKKVEVKIKKENNKLSGELIVPQDLSVIVNGELITGKTYRITINENC